MRAFSCICLGLTLFFPLAAMSTPVTYDFSWTGADGFTMTGNFTYDSSSAADGQIRSSEVESLSFNGYEFGVLVGSSSIAPSEANFNFNFNSALGQFDLNGLSSGPDGQQWNYGGAGFGFAAGLFSSALTNSNALLGLIENPTPLVATLVSNSVPEPSSIGLGGLGLGLLGISYRRRSKQVRQ